MCFNPCISIAECVHLYICMCMYMYMTIVVLTFTLEPLFEESEEHRATVVTEGPGSPVGVHRQQVRANGIIILLLGFGCSVHVRACACACACANGKMCIASTCTCILTTIH